MNSIFRYEKEVIFENASDSKATDEEGDVLGYETLIHFYWEFIHIVCEKKSLHSLLKSNLPGLCYVAIGYMQVTREQVSSLCDPCKTIIFPNYSQQI